MIFFVAPDLARPSGGVRTIYRCVDLLNAAGVAAAVLHSQQGFRCRWFENDTAIVYAPRRLGGRDTLVVPEQLAAELDHLAPGVRKVVFNQNAYRSFRSSTATGGALAASLERNPDLVGILTVSEDNRRYLERAFPGVAITRVHHWIDPDVFSVDLIARRHQISVMPRKRRGEFEQLTAILGARHALDGWDLEILEGRSERAVATELRRSVLFVSLAKEEGFGLPAAEALACGCHVIGFHGMGGRELFESPFAHAIEDGDVLGLATAVEDFLVGYDARTAELERQAVDAATFVHSRYSHARATADLTCFFEPLARSPQGDVESVVSPRDLLHESRVRRALRYRLRQLGRRL